MEKQHSKPILILGIGIFFWAVAATYAFLFQYTLRNAFFLIDGISPFVNVLLNEILYLATFIGLLLPLLSILKAGKINHLTLFFTSIGLVIVGQILQFLVPIFLSNIMSEAYWHNSSVYVNFYGVNIFAQVVVGIFNVLLYGLVAWLIYKNRNLILKSDSQESDINEIGRNS